MKKIMAFINTGFSPLLPSPFSSLPPPPNKFPVLTIQTSFLLLYRAVLNQYSYTKTISFIVSVVREGSFSGVTLLK